MVDGRRGRPVRSGQIAAALLGTLPPSLLGAAGLARFLPCALGTRFVVGYLLALPLWLAAICFAILTRDGRRAWLGCAAATLLAACACYGPDACVRRLAFPSSAATSSR